MVVRCAICGTSSFDKKVRMFVVPGGEYKRWNKACNRKMGKWSNVCEKHFEKDCFKESDNSIHLKPGSVPTLFLSSAQIADGTKILQDTSTAGFKILQSKVQTFCLQPAHSGSTTTSAQCAALTAAPSLSKLPLQCVTLPTPNVTKPPAQSVSTTSPVQCVAVTTTLSLPKSPIQCATLTTTSFIKPTVSTPPSLIKSPALAVSTTTLPQCIVGTTAISLSKPSIHCALLAQSSLTKSTAPDFAKLPASLTITPSCSSPMPPIEFVSVNTPIKPLRSEIVNAPLLQERLQVRTLLNSTSGKRVETIAVKKPTPVKIEIQKFKIPCKITKIDPSQIKSQPILQQISASVTHNGNKVDFATQTVDEIITGGTYLENLKLKTENSHLKAEISRLKKKIEVDAHQNRNIAKLFTENQIRKLRTPNTHVSWVWEDICWAITLQAAGPRAYKHLYHKGFPIPSIATLQRWIRNIKFECGILTQVIDILKDIAELQLDDRVCVLCFDEIELSPNNNVNANITQRQFAQIAIVRGLKSPWKQPIFYDFNCIMSKSVITNIISSLYAADFVVVAMVAKLDNDQILLDELEISKEKNWFEHPCDTNAKIYTFIDAPQLLNLIRNQFIDDGFVFGEKFISSYNIQQILLSRLSETKLNNIHLEIKNFGREKIKMATQLFSKTTANSILKYKTNSNTDSHNAIECANFIKLIDDWFEIFSSTPCSITTKKAFGLSLENQIKTLENINELMERNAIPITSTSLMSFQDGVLLTNKSLCDLYAYVKDKYKMDYVLTFRLNQDILETFFDSIKGDDSACQNLSPNDFQQSLRKYLFSGNVRHFRKNFKDLANQSNDDNNENENDDYEEPIKLLTKKFITDERCAEKNIEDGRTLSRCLIPNNFGSNNTLEDCLMDAGIEGIHKEEEKYMEDYVLNEFILEDL